MHAYPVRQGIRIMGVGKEGSARFAPRARVAALIAALAGAFLVTMVAVENFGPRFIVEPSSWQSEATVVVAMLSVALLASDVVLPVPSSIVLVANGAVFGVVVGCIISTLGLVAGALLGYWLGWRGADGAERLVGIEGSDWLTARTARHGFWVVGATRGVPLASEITAVLSGATGMPLRRFILAAVVGAGAASAPMAFVGARAISIGSGVTLAVAATFAGAVLWCTGRRLSREPV